MSLQSILAFCAVAFICNLSFGQQYTTTADDQHLEIATYQADSSYTDEPTEITPPSRNHLTAPKISSISDKDWNKIKKQLSKAKRRAATSQKIITSKVMDTIFVDIPTIPTTEISGSDWVAQQP